MVFAFRRRVLGTAGLPVWGLLAAIGLMAAPAAAETLNVNIDQSRIIPLSDRVTTVVIGNPLIADASLQGGMLVLTGKGYGSTNMVALDRNGRTISSNEVQVISAGTGDVVTVYRGIERETYSCAPFCERRITLGDSPAYFSATISQTGTRNGQASPPVK